MAADTDNPKAAADRIQGRQVDLILRQLDSLPTLPAVATRLLSLTASRQAKVEEIVSLIQADQTLTAKLLSLAGRASTGLRREARTIDKVVMLLGFEAVRSAVLSIKVLETFAITSGTAAASTGPFNRAEFWKHCVAVASAADLIAQRLHLNVDSEEAFTCGLLHDIGKLALDCCLPKSYARVVEAANAQFGNIADYERHVIGVDHTIVGRRLAQIWGLPTLVEQVVWLHHQPVETLPEMLPGRQMIAVVHLADTLAREQRFGYSGNHTFVRSSAELGSHLGLTETALRAVAEALPRQIEQRCAILGLGQTTSESLLRSALANANAELGRMNEVYRLRASRLGEQGRMLKLSRGFADSLTARTTLSDLVEQIARVWGQAVAAQPSPSGALLAYAVCAAEQKLVVAAINGEQPARLLLLPANGPVSPPPPSADPAAALSALTGEADRLHELLGLQPSVHRALVCGGQWVGGLLWPSADPAGAGENDALDALAASLGFALAAVEARENADVLAEQLSQASAALYAAQQELTETRTLAAVGEMAAGAAHEINNPLAVVVGRAELMAESTTGKDAQTWRTIADQAQRMSDIITEMMEFARPAEPKPQTVNVADLAQQAREQLAKNPSMAALKIDVQIAEGTPAVQVDPQQISGVLAELMTNAAAAYAENPHVRIETAPSEAAGQVVIRVIDQGSGMDPATLQNAFTPFFSAKAAGRARGLGLSKARRLVQLAGGRIWIQSELGKGTTVSMSLPRAGRSAAGRPGKA